MTFRIIDEDTGRALESADVQVATSAKTFNTEAVTASMTSQLAGDHGRTDDKGLVTLNVPFGRLPTHISVRAPGYLSATRGFPDGFVGAQASRQAPREIALYALPLGKAVLILPAGFRGELHVVSTGRMAYAAHQREFEITVTPGEVTRVGSFEPILEGGSGVAFWLEARFVNSEQLLLKQNHSDFGSSNSKTPPDAIALRLVAMTDNRSIFWVGTAEDAIRFQQEHDLSGPSGRGAFDHVFPKLH